MADHEWLLMLLRVLFFPIAGAILELMDPPPRDPAVDEEPDRGGGSLDLTAAICRILTAVNVAGGPPTEAGFAATARAFNSMVGYEPSQAYLRISASEARKGPYQITRAVAALREELDEEPRRAVYRAAVLVARADGEVNDSAREVLQRIDAGLGLTT